MLGGWAGGQLIGMLVRPVSVLHADSSWIPDRRIFRRMPRLQVYLPEDLYREVKERRLPASELLQEAVRAEIRRRELLAETDRYLRELVEEVGEPSPAAVARAEALAKRVTAKRLSPEGS